MNRPSHDIIHGEPSLSISSSTVRAWVTLRGGHVAPVEFSLESGTFQPYSLSPWLPGELEDLDPLLDVLRGDFWCMPFGEQPDGPAHGHVACGQWTPVKVDPRTVTMTIDARDIGARVDKTISLRDGQSALFQELTITGLDGDFSYGTHPILDLSHLPPGIARISSGAVRWSSVFTGEFSKPSLGETQVLLPGAQFTSLASIPLIDGGSLDLSRYPTSMAHEDLVMLSQLGDDNSIGWTAVSAPGYVWCALKDVRDFPSTVLWVSNGGRTQEPWLGRHVGRLGVEDVCSYFHEGLVASREDRLRDQGIPTARTFASDVPVTMRTVQAMVASPPGFAQVVDISTNTPGRITLTDELGCVIEALIDWQYVLSCTHPTID